MTRARTNFDIKLELGELAEETIRGMFTGEVLVESKSDQQWITTKNFYVESECYKASKGGWVRSGVYEPALEEDTLFWYEFSGFHLAGPVSAWRYAVETRGIPVSGGDSSNPSRGYLITPQEVISAFREWRQDNNGN